MFYAINKWILVWGLLFFVQGLGFSQTGCIIYASDTVGCAPLIVHFSDSVYGGTYQSKIWNFDDRGFGSTADNPSYEYRSAGEYNVKLTINQTGIRDTCFKRINVLGPEIHAPQIEPCPDTCIDIIDSITISGGTLPYRNYTWWDCSYNFLSNNGDSLRSRYHCSSEIRCYYLTILDDMGCNSLGHIVIWPKMESCLSTSLPVFVAGGINISPNPATSELIIETSDFEPKSLSVYDINGRKLMEEHFHPRLNVSALTPGIYYLELKNQAKTVRKRWVKL